MDTSLHYLLMVTHTLFQKRVLNKLSCVGLSAGQPKVLDYLGLHDGSMQKSIAVGCQIDPATLTGILNRMSEKGMIERRFKDNNHRSMYVYLTEYGKKLQEEVSRCFKECEKEVLEDFSVEEKDKLITAFRQLCEKMTDTEGLQ